MAAVIDGACLAVDYMVKVKCEAKFQARFLTLSQLGWLRNPDLMRKLSGSVWEIKVDQGPGRRVYGCWQGRVFVLTHGANKPKSVEREVSRSERIFEVWKNKESGGRE